MSEYERAKQIIRSMRLPKSAAQDQARKAFHADLGAGRPDVALLCAKDFDLGNDYLTRAATELFLVLVQRGRFQNAYDILKGYNLIDAGPDAERAIKVAMNLDKLPSAVVQKLKPEDQVSLKKILRRSQKLQSRRLRITDPDQAISLIERAAEARRSDPKIQGRAIVLPADGDLMLCGDFHGNTDNLLRFVELANLDANPKRILVIQEILHARVLAKDERDLSFETILYALDLQARYPGRVYYMIGNHDLGYLLGKDLIKAGKSLNRYLHKGMQFQFGDRFEDVSEKYKDFIEDMPAAIMTANGIFMSHSTPKGNQLEDLTPRYLTEIAAERPFRKCKPIVALVNGRDYQPETARAFCDQMEVEHLICGHTPTAKGVKVPNDHHIIIDSQHANARYIRFDLNRPYDHDELVGEVKALQATTVAVAEIGELV